jgi:hypothetical protein
MFNLAFFNLVLTDSNLLSDVVLLEFDLSVSQEIYHRDETGSSRKTVVTCVMQFPFSLKYLYLRKIEGFMRKYLIYEDFIKYLD